LGWRWNGCIRRKWGWGEGSLLNWNPFQTEKPFGRNFGRLVSTVFWRLGRLGQELEEKPD
jgi:hypothetical protein